MNHSTLSKRELFESALACHPLPLGLQEEILSFTVQQRWWPLVRALAGHRDTAYPLLLRLAATGRSDVISTLLMRPDCPNEVLVGALSDSRPRVRKALAGRTFDGNPSLHLEPLVESSDQGVLRTLLRNESAVPKTRLSALVRLVELKAKLEVADVASLLATNQEAATSVSQLEVNSSVLALACQFSSPSSKTVECLAERLCRDVLFMTCSPGQPPFRDLLAATALVNSLVAATTSKNTRVDAVITCLREAAQSSQNANLSREIETLAWKLTQPRPFPSLACAAALMAAPSREVLDANFTRLVGQNCVPALAVKAVLVNPHAEPKHVYELALMADPGPASWAHLLVTKSSPPAHVASLMQACPLLGPDVFLSRCQDPAAVLACALAESEPLQSLSRSRYLTRDLVLLAPASWVLRAPGHCQEWAWEFARSSLLESQWGAFSAIAPTFSGSWREAVIAASLL